MLLIVHDNCLVSMNRKAQDILSITPKGSHQIIFGVNIAVPLIMNALKEDKGKKINNDWRVNWFGIVKIFSPLTLLAPFFLKL